MDAGVGIAPSHVAARRSTLPLAIALFLISFLLHLLALRRFLNGYDEGLITVAAQRILEGDVPYRDFWGLYAPGQYYVVAALFKVFGSSILTERIYEAFTTAAIAVSAFALVDRCANRWLAFGAWIVCTTWVLAFNFTNFPVFPALFLTLWAAAAVLLFLEAPSRRLPLVAAGLFVGLTAVFRHDLGFYAAASIAILLVMFSISEGADRKVRRSAVAVDRVGFFCLGILCAAGPVFVLLLAAVPVHDLVFDLLIGPIQIYPPTRAVPFPPIWPLLTQAIAGAPAERTLELALYMPLLIVAVAALAWLAGALRPDPDSSDRDANRARKREWICILFMMLTASFYLKGIVRVSTLHMTPSIVLAFVLFFLLAASFRRCPALIKVALAGCGLIIAIFTVLAASTVIGAVQRNLRTGFGDICNPPSGLERAACFSMEPDRQKALEYIVANTTAEDPVFVGAGRHDKIFANDIIFYFLAARRPATRWHELHPGFATTAPIQAEMVAELIRSRPPYVVLNTGWDNAQEPNDSALSSGVTTLDDFIRSSYRPVASFGTYQILKLDSPRDRGVGAP
jgi:hypothetical protein